MKNYLKDEEANLWVRPEFKGISYSDGEEVEQRLLKLLADTKDIESLSEELESKATDWPSEYHFSRQRHCLVRPLGIKEGDRVLELGCGCGAITRFLGETGAHVTSVEGGFPRARIAAARCRDLANVTIVCEDLLSFSTEEAYDWVLLVGVLEYAPVFSSAGAPILDYLERAGSYLAGGGRLVVAIENQLGIKYFNGCSEDHLGEHFLGVNDLYGTASPITFGRRELEEKLGSAGFGSTEFYYPYPDYKLPTTIVREPAFEHQEFSVSELLMRTDSRDYIGKTRTLFSEPLAGKVLDRNGLLKNFANSFLVVASKEPESERASSDLAWIYSIGKRKVAFCTETHFQDENGSVGVKKSLLKPLTVSVEDTGMFKVGHELPLEKYISGPLVGWDIFKACLTDDSVENIVGSFMPWFKALKEKAHLLADMPPDQLDSWVLQGDMFDATPFNCIAGENGGVFFDKEWKIQGQIPLGWVVFRSVIWSLSAGLYLSKGEVDIVAVMAGICRKNGLDLKERLIHGWVTLEEMFQGKVMYGVAGSIPCRLVKKVGSLTELDDLTGRVKLLDTQIKELDQLLTQKGDIISNQDRLIVELDRLIVEHDIMISGKDILISEKDIMISEKNRVLADQEGRIQTLSQNLEMVYASRSWQITRPYRFLARHVSALFR